MPRNTTSNPRNSRVEHIVLKTLERHSMIAPGDKVLAAISGGGDSVGMLRLLLAHRTRCPFKIEIAHVNHGLRGLESDQDADFVAELARAHGLRFHSTRVDLARGPSESSSVEERARIARRNFLLETAATAGCSRIALGHTLDDQVETILMWLLRGTGRIGLAGMEPVTCDGIIRPIIGTRRKEIRDYLDSLGEEFRDDETNENLERTRNMLRHELVPQLEEKFPGCAAVMASEAEILSAEDRYLDQAAGELLEPDMPGIDVDRLRRAGPALARRAIRLAAGRSGMEIRSLGRELIALILEMVGSPGDGALDLPGGYRAISRANRVIFERRERSGP
jgi:tRNA(Ile)-lysidine synthase